MNGIIIDGKVYESVAGEKHSCLRCDMIDDRGSCDFRDFCYELGRNNIFRFSQTLTDKLTTR